MKRFVFVWNADSVWGADLVDMQKMAKNSGYQYILMIRDAFSKYAWVVPLKQKSESEVSQALRRVLQKNKFKQL